jgi:hypothetical protein
MFRMRKVFVITAILSVFVASIAVAQRSVVPRNPTLRAGTYIKGNSSASGKTIVGSRVAGGGQIVTLIDRYGVSAKGVIKFSGRDGSIRLDSGEIIRTQWVNETTFTSGNGATWRRVS